MVHTIKKIMTVRDELDNEHFGYGREMFMVTTQVEGYPKTTAFLDDDLVGLQKKDADELAKKVVKDMQRSNPDLKVVKE